LPITFPRSIDDVPAFTSYAMKGRTYRYLEREPLYPFGYGLSYAQFAYRDIAVSLPTTGKASDIRAIHTPHTANTAVARVTAVVDNVGKRAGDEVVQLYVKDVEASCVVPHHDLRGFQRIHLEPGESRKLTFDLTARDLSLVDDRGRRVLEPGRFRVTIGGSQPDPRSAALTGQAPLAIEFDIPS
jgi:beta-glucosidase